ncbi:hypothetical protein IFT48_01085 [Pseudomonas fluorescens]|uniref:hypothetical protein n=1 Tax=Pseudomonas TaxID=286 RepID=UPI0017807C61|nr:MULTISPECIES: hypothetical protein [Pseudomonas]MBD8088587.1 hypothetical protein [Pseudomonas fluorescens]MBD8614952.1 hypothetical protein [Pseudomonas putida]MBD8681365.1 hypothetical protein [Pseudomonas sp. CFBP 13719]
MRQANLNALATQGGWTLKKRDELMGLCQQFGQQQRHSSLTASLYKLQRIMVLEGMTGHEPLIPIIIHESLKNKVSQQQVEQCAGTFEVIDPDFRQTFAIGVSLISAHLCRDLECANSTILQFYVSEEQALEKLLELPQIFRGEQWAIRLRPFLSPDNQRMIEDRIIGLSPSLGTEPGQRLFSSLTAYLKLAFDQDVMPSEITAKPRMGLVAKTVVSYLLCADRMVYKANEGLLRMLSGWIRDNILSLDEVSHPFAAADRVKQLCPRLLHDPRNFPESWKKTLLVSSDNSISR